MTVARMTACLREDLQRSLHTFQSGIELQQLILCDRKLYYSLNSNRQIFFPGCKCGISQTCAKSGTACNCNKNDYVWRSDRGYVTEMFRLPLTKVCIGETGDSDEEMSFKIGPVECESAV